MRLFLAGIVVVMLLIVTACKKDADNNYYLQADFNVQHRHLLRDDALIY